MKTNLVLDFASRVTRDGRIGRPPKEPHRMVMLRMNKRVHSAMRTFCVQNDLSQREFIEAAAEHFIIARTLSKRVRALTQNVS